MGWLFYKSQFHRLVFSANLGTAREKVLSIQIGRVAIEEYKEGMCNLRLDLPCP